MKSFFVISIIAFSQISCKKNSEQISKKNATADSQQLEKYKTCYLSVIGKDSVRISIIDPNGNISGDLDFRSSETDWSVGTFTGTKSGETLKLKFRTVAEGYVSYNDIYLLQKDGKLYEGVSEISKINDSTTAFVNPVKVDYSKSYVFSKFDCK